MNDSTTRFSNRVKDYIRYRPSYPKAWIDYLNTKPNFSPQSVVADLGSGTGISSELFLKNGNPTFAIEPNEPMRKAAEELLAHYPNFTSINGTAETTTLDNQSVDCIVAAQAFHWFDLEKTRVECERILKPNGFICMIWNERSDENPDFMNAYSEFLDTYSTGYKKVYASRISMKLKTDFFGHDNIEVAKFPHYQVFDKAGLLGRYMSCSYAPSESDAIYPAAKAALGQIFEDYQENGIVKMWYEATAYIGILK